jgi:hypothetical protein
MAARVALVQCGGLSFDLCVSCFFMDVVSKSVPQTVTVAGEGGSALNVASCEVS